MNRNAKRNIAGENEYPVFLYTLNLDLLNKREYSRKNTVT